MGIVADLLAAAARSGDDEGGAKITTIIRKGNVSYAKAEELLSGLVQAGLVAEANQGGKSRYIITSDGFRYLATYRSFEDFAKSFGLRL